MKLLEHILGFVVLSLGIVFVINARLGAGSMDAFNYYLTELIKDQSSLITLGRIAILNGTFAMFLGYFIGKDKKIFVSFIFLFIVGNFIDIWQYFFNFIPIEFYQSLLARFILAGIGVVVISFGVAMTLLTGYSPSPFEALLMVLDKKINNISITKMLIDGTYLIVAIILGILYGNVFEQIGIFTIVLTFLTGVLVKHFRNQIYKYKSKKGAI